jgi:hypothetical protein
VARRLLIPLLAAAALSGCGGGDEQTTAAPAPTPPAAATEAPTATPTATPTVTPTPTATDAPTPQSPEAQPGGAGDEQETRVPIELTIAQGGIKPPQVSVPGFLALELILHNKLPVEVVVRLQGANPIAVGPGETARAKLAGRKPGRYIIDAGAAGKALLVTGVDPGP